MSERTYRIVAVEKGGKRIVLDEGRTLKDAERFQRILDALNRFQSVSVEPEQPPPDP